VDAAQGSGSHCTSQENGCRCIGQNRLTRIGDHRPAGCGHSLPVLTPRPLLPRSGCSAARSSPRGRAGRPQLSQSCKRTAGPHRQHMSA
jgi:hypothetical protein